MITLLDDTERQYCEIHAHDAAAHRLALALARPSWPIARMACRQEQTHTCCVHDSLLHGEALLVVAARDAEDVAFEFVADAVARDFLTHAAVHEDAEFAFIFNFDQFLGTVGWKGDIELHYVGRGGRGMTGDEVVVMGKSKVSCFDQSC